MTLVVIQTLTTIELPGNALELRGDVVAKDAETTLLVAGPVVRVLCLPRVVFFLLEPSSPGGVIVVLSQMTLVSAAVTPASVPWLSWLIFKRTWSIAFWRVVVLWFQQWQLCPWRGQAIPPLLSFNNTILRGGETLNPAILFNYTFCSGWLEEAKSLLSKCNGEGGVMGGSFAYVLFYFYFV